MERAIIIVLDSFGVGATADADRFGDEGANTLGNIAKFCVKHRDRALELPNLCRLGLYHAARENSGEFPAGYLATGEIIGAYGYATPTPRRVIALPASSPRHRNCRVSPWESQRSRP